MWLCQLQNHRSSTVCKRRDEDRHHLLLLHKQMHDIAKSPCAPACEVGIFLREISKRLQYNMITLYMNFWLHRYKAIHLIRAYQSVYSRSLLRHGVIVQALPTIMDHTCWSQPLSTPQQHLLFQVSPPSVTLLQEFIARFLPVTLLLVSLWVNND